MEKIAIIKINPESKSAAMDIQTNGVSNLDMLEFMQMASQLFAEEIIKEDKELGRSSDVDFDRYIKFLRTNKL